MKLKDKVAVITGGTAGLGSATVKRFLDEGAKVVFSYRSGRERAEEMLEELAGCPVDAFQADVSVSEQVQALIQHTIDKFGRIDILVNNAGVFDKRKNILELSEDEWDTVMDTNGKAVFLACKYTIPHMLEAGGGTIVNVASVATWSWNSGGTAYCASKHVCQVLTRRIARDFGPQGIKCNCINPGTIQTNLTKSNIENPDDLIHQVVKKVAAGRWAQPEEIANLIVFLSNEESDFMQGSPVLIDGGWSLL
ncbi:MAG: SDR family oxidoreductase [Oscillospiraceae bacterium]|nr:SDR family oxidoreductase [Oscillospiraceae bacterium]